MTISGRDIRVGDTVEVWWQNRRDTVTGLRPYVGSLLPLLGAGTQIAEFASGLAMTIEPDARLTLIHRAAVAA